MIVPVIIILCTDPEIRFPGFNGTAGLIIAVKKQDIDRLVSFVYYA